MKLRFCRLLSIIVLVFGLADITAQAQTSTLACGCEFSKVPGAVWWRSDPQMSVADLAAHAAPVFWFSPDEPSLLDAHGVNIMTPEPFPFETADGPVVYYQLKEVVRDARTDDPAFERIGEDIGSAVLDLDFAALLSLEYYAYFADEAGFGAHQHDVEGAEFRIAVAHSDGKYLKDYDLPQCGQRHYILQVTRVSGKAHGIEWYWNVLDVDEGTRFPMFLLVEEGKHALATDKNADGYFTPTYDVNVRINDAWGVRDIIRSGGLLSGGYQAWMTKVRHAEDRVFPPLLKSSPLFAGLAKRQAEYSGENAVYKLRPLPLVVTAAAYDDEQGEGSHLQNFLVDKEVANGPRQKDITSMSQALSWMDAGALKRSFSASVYTDGRWGVSWSFPFFVAKNLQIPMSGGYVMHRMYLKGDNFKDFGWTAMYANSASRWVDSYLAVGVEWRDVGLGGVEDIQPDFVLDFGLKFRGQIGKTPIGFLSALTEFWGVRLGIKNYGISDIEHLTYIMEIGAGSF